MAHLGDEAVLAWSGSAVWLECSSAAGAEAEFRSLELRFAVMGTWTRERIQLFEHGTLFFTK